MASRLTTSAICSACVTRWLSCSVLMMCNAALPITALATDRSKVGLDTQGPATSPADLFVINDYWLHSNSVTAFGRHWPPHHTENQDCHCISGQLPKIWNSLPPVVRSSDSITSFWYLLKSHLFDFCLVFLWHLWLIVWTLHCYSRSLELCRLID